MTQSELDKVQEICIRASRLVGISEVIGMDGEDRMDGISVDDMKLLLNFVIALSKKRDDLELTIDGIMWYVDKWLEGDELNQEPIKRAIIMREKTLKIAEELDKLKEMNK